MIEDSVDFTPEQDDLLGEIYHKMPYINKLETIGIFLYQEIDSETRQLVLEAIRNEVSREVKKRINAPFIHFIEKIHSNTMGRLDFYNNANSREYSKILDNATSETSSRYNHYKRAVLTSLEGASSRGEDLSTLNDLQLFKNMGISFCEAQDQLNNRFGITFCGTISMTDIEDKEQDDMILVDKNIKTGKFRLSGNVTDFLENIDKNISEVEPYERIHQEKYYKK